MECAEQFRYVDRVDSSRIPFEILQSLSSVADYLIDTEFRHCSIIRLDPRQAYTITSAKDLFSRLFTAGAWERTVELSEFQNLDPSSLLLFGFPSEDAKKILHHALAAHEFGHFVVSKNNMNSKILAIIEANKGKAYITYRVAIEEKISEIAERVYLKKRGTLSRSEIHNLYEKLINKHVADVVKSWVYETFADLVGSRLIGPAYIAALDRMLITSRDFPSDSHPPRLLRLQICSKFINDLNNTYFSDDPVWKLVINSYTGKHFAFTEIDYEMAMKTIENAESELITAVNSIPSLLDNKDLDILVSQIEDHIFHLAPPSCLIEIKGNKNDAAGFWMILLAAWHFRLCEDKFKKFLERYGWGDNIEKGEEVLSNLVVHSLKSLEIMSHSLRNGQG